MTIKYCLIMQSAAIEEEVEVECLPEQRESFPNANTYLIAVKQNMTSFHGHIN